jgi:hypothetical protein
MAELSRFQPLSAPDYGMDGYDSDSRTIFQFYFPEGTPRRDKILKDLKKAEHEAWACTKWVLLLPKDPSASLWEWMAKTQKNISFAIEIWGETQILRLLRKHPDIKEQFFPTELLREIRRVKNGKQPKNGDADFGKQITPEMAAELRQLISLIAEEEATRRKRAARPGDYSREFGEFTAHFQLSSYDRLPSNHFVEARKYLEAKRFGRRQGETSSKGRTRYIAGIKAMQKDLKITDREYRRLLLEISGKYSTTEMDLASLRRVFEHFRHLQGRVIAQDPIPEFYS